MTKEQELALVRVVLSVVENVGIEALPSVGLSDLADLKEFVQSHETRFAPDIDNDSFVVHHQDKLSKNRFD